MANDTLVRSGGPNGFRDLLEGLLLCSEETKLVFPDIRTVLINGAGVGGVFYQRTDDRFAD